MFIFDLPHNVYCGYMVNIIYMAERRRNLVTLLNIDYSKIANRKFVMKY